MFGPAGDDWGGPDWKGWWGDNPPYQAPTFILTHHARAPIAMEGGTTFYSSPRGSSGARPSQGRRGRPRVKHWRRSFDGPPVSVAGAIDELHLALSPVVLGRGESLFAGIDLPGLWLSGEERSQWSCEPNLC